MSDVQPQLDAINAALSEKNDQIAALGGKLDAFVDGLKTNVVNILGNLTATSGSEVDPSREGWVVLKEKIVEYAFEIVLLFTFFWPDTWTAFTISILLGFKLFGAYLGKLFQQITAKKDVRLHDKDREIGALKDALNLSTKQVYALEAKLGAKPGALE
jgi:hypothetical protein